MLERPPISLGLAALRESDAGLAHEPRRSIEFAASSGFRWVTLDGAAPGCRARELDRSARRDLAALFRRLELGINGLDLWIPADHFRITEHADRAMGALTGAIDLIAELTDLNGGERVVSVTLPPDADLRDAAASLAESQGVLLADHAWPPFEPASEIVACGLDPAQVLLAGDNPAKAAARLGPRLGVARLTDASQSGRVVPGGRDGRLNDLAYVVALDTAKHARPLVLDLRHVPRALDAIAHVRRWWAEA